MTSFNATKSWASALFAGALLFPGAADAVMPEPVLLERQGKWIAQYEDNACNLIATFGTGTDAVVMRLSRYSSGQAMMLSLYGKRFGFGYWRSKVRLGFGFTPDLPAFDTVNAMSGDMPMIMIMGFDLLDRRRTHDRSEFPPPTAEQVAAIKGLTFSFERRQPVRLVFDGFSAPMKALDKCTETMVKSWGLDPQEQASLSRYPTPRGSPGNWLSVNAYPKSMLKEHRSGYVLYRLNVDETGGVTDCQVLQHLKPQEFETATCAMLRKNAQFLPALNADKKPVRSIFIGAVGWLSG